MYRVPANIHIREYVCGQFAIGVCLCLNCAHILIVIISDNKFQQINEGKRDEWLTREREREFTHAHTVDIIIINNVEIWQKFHSG